MQMIRCPACGATNRVPQEKLDLGLAPKCGRCKTALPVSGKPLVVTDATFAEDITLLALRNGREVDRLIGAHPKSEIARWLERAIA